MAPWLVLLAAVAAGLSLLIAGVIYRSRTSPHERERRRRMRINMLGRLGDGMLTDMDGNLLHYSYSVHGVPYNTSQDISVLRNLVPEDSNLIVGPLTLKYLPRNPANSIVISETWSGLRIRPKSAYDPVELGPLPPIVNSQADVASSS